MATDILPLHHNHLAHHLAQVGRRHQRLQAIVTIATQVYISVSRELDIIRSASLAELRVNQKRRLAKRAAHGAGLMVERVVVHRLERCIRRAIRHADNLAVAILSHRLVKRAARGLDHTDRAVVLIRRAVIHTTIANHVTMEIFIGMTAMEIRMM